MPDEYSGTSFNLATWVKAGIETVKVPEGVDYIEDSAFSNCPNLTSVNIPSTVVGYGSAAFSNCPNLTEINIYKSDAVIETPTGNTTVGAYAFSGCPNLKKIVINEGVTEATSSGALAYTGCTELVLPDSLRTIEWAAMGTSSTTYNIDKLTISGHIDVVTRYYETVRMYRPKTLTIAEGSTGIGSMVCCTNSGTGIVSGYRVEKLILPATLISLPALHNCSNITEVHIPSLEQWCSLSMGISGNNTSSTSVCCGPFRQGYNTTLYIDNEPVTDVVIPSIFDTIKNYTFGNQRSLVSVVIPSTITSIGTYAFYGCTNLKSLSIPNNDITINTRAFHKTMSSSSHDLPITNLSITAGNLTTLNTGLIIGASTITTVELSDGIENIPESSFANCSKLTTINIPDTITYVGTNAFTNTPILINQTDSLKYIDNWVISCDTSLSDSVMMDDSTRGVACNAFSACTLITTVHFPETLISICDNAFNGCTSLTEVHLPAQLTYIGESAFSGCTNLASLSLPGDLTLGTSAFANCTAIKNLKFTEGTTHIQSYSTGTLNIRAIESVSFPDTVVDIASGAFYGCGSLTEVHISDINKWAGVATHNSYSTPFLNSPDIYINDELITSIDVVVPDDVEKIYGYVFYKCKVINNLTISDSVTSIGQSAFSSCTGLKSVEIGTNVTSIGQSAFSNCTSLTSVKIPDSVTSIGQSAFSSCTSLTSVKVGNGVDIVNSYLFRGCTNLENIILPSSITNIGDYAFNNCNNLKFIYFMGTENEWNSITFGTNWNTNMGSNVEVGTQIIYNYTPNEE